MTFSPLWFPGIFDSLAFLQRLSQLPFQLEHLATICRHLLGLWLRFLFVAAHSLDLFKQATAGPSPVNLESLSLKFANSSAFLDLSDGLWCCVNFLLCAFFIGTLHITHFLVDSSRLGRLAPPHLFIILDEIVK